MGMLTVGLVIMVACDSSDKSSATLDNQSKTNQSTQNTNGYSSNVVSTEIASTTESTKKDTNEHDTNKKAEPSNNVPTNEEDSSTNNTVSLKEEYLKKLNDTKKETDEIRKNSEDEITYVLKSFEGDRFDVWDGLLNEVYQILKQQLPSEEMEQLRKEQREWIDYRDKSAKEASLKYKGGTMEHLEYTTVLNNLTEERCFELVEDYMK